MFLVPPKLSQRPGKRCKPVDSTVEVENQAETGFIEHVDALKSSSVDAIMVDAVDYLRNGPPYRGESVYSDRELVKDAGAKWTRTDDLACWAAPDRNSLLLLLKLRRSEPHAAVEPPHADVSSCEFKKYKSRARKPLANWQVAEPLCCWHPMGLSIDAARRVGHLLRDYECKADAHVNTASVTTTVNRLASLQEAMRARDIPEDDAADVRQLWERYGVAFDAAMSTASSQLFELGPHVGVSSARRVLRGLHLKTITTDELLQRTARPPPTRDPSTTASLDAVDETRRLQTPVANSVHFESKPSQHDSWNAADVVAKIRPCVWETPRVLTTTCGVCNDVVNLQFSDCSCLGKHWKGCAACGAPSCREQACPNCKKSFF